MIPCDIVFVEHVGPYESYDICVCLLVARILVKRTGRENFLLFQPKIFRFRFFFPWPYQPHQCFCANTERVALQRRLPADDQWATRLCCSRAFLIVCHTYIIWAHILFLQCPSNRAVHCVCIFRCCPYQVVPHNIYLAMYSPASVNVLAFDPELCDNGTKHMSHQAAANKNTTTTERARACRTTEPIKPGAMRRSTHR